MFQIALWEGGEKHQESDNSVCLPTGIHTHAHFIHPADLWPDALASARSDVHPQAFQWSYTQATLKYWPFPLLGLPTIVISVYLTPI